MLHILALIRLTLMLGKDEEAKSFCRKYFPSVGSFSELTANEGIPPDWCSTILNFVLAVHCRSIIIDSKAAYLLRNYLFKNFAYKLRGLKRACIIATLFTGLRYDFVSIEKTPDILNNGEYVLTKFVSKKYLYGPDKLISEIRIYVCVACIVMADLYQMLKLFQAARNFQRTRAGNIADFLMAIMRRLGYPDAHEKKRRYEYVSHPRYSLRWKTAIAYSRLFDETAPVTDCGERWRSIIRSIEDNK